ncbi:MAG: type II secretion system F family protein [Lentisphaeria bacterium]|nr:type II secretion system F family protein [Lentisphaeria bacterium]
MPTFQYTAMDGAGKEKRGKIEAANEQDAGAKLKHQGLFITNISSAKASGKRGPANKAKGGKKGGAIVLGTPVIKKKKLTTFTRQMATLLDAGQALVRALRTLERQAGKDVAVARVLGDIADSVEGGTTFSEALAAHPKTFSKLYVSMVRAGEAAGQLEGTLQNLAMFMEKAERIAGKIKSAMAYPAVVLTVALGITTFLLIFLVPKFAQIFDDMLPGEELPGLTQFVVSTSKILKEQFILVALSLVGLVLLFHFAKKTKQGGYFIDAVFFKTPPFASLVVRSSVARVSRTLGTLMDSGVSVLQALQIAAETSGNEVIARAIRSVHDSVKEGEGMSKPMAGTGVFPPICVSMVEVGEETGALPSMLTRIADVYEDEVDRAVEALTSMIEPIMIVFLAVIVGTIVIAMFLPMISLIENL